MGHKESSSASPPTTGGHSAEPARLDADFDARWAAWHAQGVAHERAVLRKFLILAPVLAIAAAIVYDLLRR